MFIVILQGFDKKVSINFINRINHKYKSEKRIKKHKYKIENIKFAFK